MVLQRLRLLLHQCSKAKVLRQGLSLHAVIFKAGLQPDVFLSNHVLNMYAKCGDMGAAHQVFNEMAEKNLVSWSAMISGYEQASNPSMGLHIFSQMQLQPNEYIFASVFTACGCLSALAQGKQLHAHSLKSGYESISFVSNSLLSMYVNSGVYGDAFKVFSCISEPNSISYNAMIACFAKNGEFDRGLELFKCMNRQGVLLDCFSFVGALGICTSLQDLQRGKEIHCLTVKLGLDTSPFVGNVILTMYMKCNSIDEADKAFESIEVKDAISWNTLIVACSHCADHAKALRVFREMGRAGARTDDFTFTSALAACASLASMRYGSQIHCHLIRRMQSLDVAVGNALTNMYAKCGCIEHARCVFEQMPNRNLVSWNTIIAGYGNHGHGRKAVETFEQMKEMGFVPDSFTFIGLLAACNHSGLVEEGLIYFDSMEAIYGITPGIEHFACLVDLLGRAGRLEEAEKYVKAFPYGGDSVVWGSLLSACRLHGDVVVGEWVAGQLLELRPDTSSPYILLSNLYASGGRWDGVADARKMLKGSGVKKEPGHSLIQVKGMVEKFTVGDFSHLRIEEIKEVLWSLSSTVEELPL